ncbi:hypothetical protein Tco_0789526 [Tanacetum coccineum]
MKRRFQHSNETIHNCFHEVLDKMLVFSEEVIRPTTFNPNPNIPENNRRQRRMFKGAVGALDGTLIHASVPSHKQNVYRARGRPHTRGFMAPYRNVRYWLGDFRRKRAMTTRFPILKSMPKFPLVKQREITIACFAIHTFIRKEGLSDDFFAKYDQSDIHVNENIRDDNDGDAEVAQPIGSEADQQYMINLRDDIATQIMQARLSSELGEAVRRRDGYVAELRASRSCDDALKTIKMLSHMQLDDMEKAARLLLMVSDTQIKVDEKASFIMRMRNRVVV